MDDDDYPLSDTDDLSTTAAFTEDNRRSLRVGQRQRPAHRVQRRGNELTAAELMRRHNLDYSALPLAEDNEGDGDDDDDDDGITDGMVRSTTDNLLLPTFNY